MEREFLGVWIPKNIYLHKGLTPTEKLLLAEITSFSKNGVCFASNEHFSEFLGISKKHVSKLVTKLSRMGLITVDLIYKEGTKEVEKRTINPIHIDAYTPPHLGVDPHRTEEYTPTHTGVDPHLVDAYYKEQVKNTTKEQEKDKKINKKENSSELEREFDRLWQLYPRKIGKKKAFDSFNKARKVKKIPYETIENGLYKYISYLTNQETEERFIMHGSTWFNQEKWQDEYLSIQPRKKPKNALEYFQMQYGGQEHAADGNSEIIDHHTTVIPEPFQGF